MHVFLTGGAGYIGTHLAVTLLAAGHDVTIYDNFCNSHPEALRRVVQIAKRQPHSIAGDVRDMAKLTQALKQSGADSIVHLAALKSVGESVAKPLDYHEINAGGTLCLLRAMQEVGLQRLVFSSTATVYGSPDYVPLDETHRLNPPQNPYAASKRQAEQLLFDASAAMPLQLAILRYFNPVGAHVSGLIGEDPQGIPNNLMPFICQVAVGRRPALNIFGRDYQTPDGTGVRDYLHVQDLAEAHMLALLALKPLQAPMVLNLGTGRGTSVLEMVNTFATVNNIAVPTIDASRRVGDVASCYAKPDAAQNILGWRAKASLADMCRDAWRWQMQNPHGYQAKSA